jgi:hypothetical protein
MLAYVKKYFPVKRAGCSLFHITFRLEITVGCCSALQK